MRIKLLLWLLFFIVYPAIGGCNHIDSIQYDCQEIDSTTLTLKQFYISYISEQLKDKPDKQKIAYLKEKYVTKNFLSKLSKLELDYDPFVYAQDYDENWLKCIRIEKDTLSVDTYNVYLIDNFNNETYCMKLYMIKEDGEYKIDNILFCDK